MAGVALRRAPGVSSSLAVALGASALWFGELYAVPVIPIYPGYVCVWNPTTPAMEEGGVGGDARAREAAGRRHARAQRSRGVHGPGGPARLAGPGDLAIAGGHSRPSGPRAGGGPPWIFPKGFHSSRNLGGVHMVYTPPRGSVIGDTESPGKFAASCYGHITGTDFSYVVQLYYGSTTLPSAGAPLSILAPVRHAGGVGVRHRCACTTHETDSCQSACFLV